MRPKSEDMCLENLFVGALADMYDAEHRIAEAIPKLTRAAVSDGLKIALLKHLDESEGQIFMLEQVFGLFGANAKGTSCLAVIGLLEEGDEALAEFQGSRANDAAMISAMQKVEHYEIASYSSLRAWARLLGNDEAASLIEDILAEEIAASQVLKHLADAGCDQAALRKSFQDASPGFVGVEQEPQTFAFQQ